MKQKILEYLQNGKIKFHSKDDMILFFAGKYTKTPKEIKNVVNRLISSGQIYEKRKGEFVVVNNKNYIKGKIIGTSKGYAFLSPIDKNLPDFFIAQKKLSGALDGDLVLAKVICQTEESTECEVVSILENANVTVVGTITYHSKDAFVIPDNKKLNKEIFVPRKLTMQAKPNYRVVVKLNKSRSGRLNGEVIEILGESDDIYSLELGIIREHKLYEQFPEQVVNEAKKVKQFVSNDEMVGRVNLTNKKIFTIDGEDAKDFDDAVSIEKAGNNYILSVHIADVGHYVKYNTGLENEAYTRGTSVYFPNMVLPMLPVELSNGICSLNPNVNRLTLTVEMEIDPSGNIKSHKIYESVICSCHRLTYNQVYKVLCGDEIESQNLKDIKDDLLIMNNLSKILEKRRNDAGQLDLDIGETFLEVDKNFNVSFVKRRERNEAHKLIENFMVVCNEVVAKHFATLKIPFVYRIHEKPVLEKIKDVCTFFNGLGINTPKLKEITPIFIQQLLKLTQDKSYKEIANKVMLRSLQKARYQDVCLGHFGLALDYYCHFTSPIRRYPDLVIHRIIKESLHKNFTKQRKEELADFVLDASYRSSETEKNADQAERDVDDLFKAVFIKNHIGEEFEGVISGVQNYGFYVELDNTIEGLVRIESLPDDAYLYMEKSLKLKGNSHVYSIGDKVKIKVVNSNVFERKIDFVLV